MPATLRNDPPRVFVVDDHPVVRQGLCDLLGGARDLRWCGEAAGVGEALERIGAVQPDLAVVDLSLDGRGGLELIETLRDRWPRLGILVLSMYDESVYAERALAAGALAYLEKTASGEEILQALRDVWGGRIHLSRRATQAALRRSARGDAGSGPDALTNRELDVFEAIGRGLGTREIAGRLHLSVKTIESHREKIKRKLGVRSGPELIAQAVRWRIEGREGA